MLLRLQICIIARVRTPYAIHHQTYWQFFFAHSNPDRHPKFTLAEQTNGMSGCDRGAQTVNDSRHLFRVLQGTDIE